MKNNWGQWRWLEALSAKEMETNHQPAKDFVIPESWRRNYGFNEVHHIPESIGTIIIGVDSEDLMPEEFERHNKLRLERSVVSGNLIVSGTDGRNRNGGCGVSVNKTVVRQVRPIQEQELIVDNQKQV